MAEDQKIILELKNIQKSFGSLKALDDVSLDLKFGEVLGLVGDNAAGKVQSLLKVNRFTLIFLKYLSD
jgi:ABC-type sugar transport system ATPase subunit